MLDVVEKLDAQEDRTETVAVKLDLVVSEAEAGVVQGNVTTFEDSEAFMNKYEEMTKTD